ncbi:hypothetical protein MMC07_004572 [Pseudocyphellaria aurata]|nr:hypothetical protein [Pseudocyphellaria aurata]
MATAWELCMKLGFTGEIYSRGSSETLLHEIQGYAKTWDMRDVRKGRLDYVDKIRGMTYTYLYWKGSGHLHWEKPLFNGYWNLIEWPKDEARIVDLLTELFSVVIEDQLSAKNTNLVASDCGATTFAGPPEDSSASIKVEKVESRTGALTEQRQADDHSVQVATRPTFNFIGQVENEPGPVIASSEEHLVDLVTTWMNVHPNMLLDGLRRMTASLEHLVESSRAHPMIITHDQESVQVNRIQVNEGVMGWMMKRTDGSCMLGKLTGHSRTTLKYQLWLGGERGFTSGITAQKCPDKTSGKQAAVDSDSFDSFDSSDNSDSKDALNSGQKSEAPADIVLSQKNNDEFIVPLIEYRTRLPLGSETVCPKTPEVLANNTQGERGCPASPLSCMRTVQRPRSPAAVPSLKLRGHRRRARSRNRANSRSPSPGSLPYTPRSSPLKTPKTRAAKSPRSTPKVSVAAQVLPAPELLESAPKNASQTQLPLPPESQQAKTPEPSPSTKNVLFQFYLANEEDGAIHQPLENCRTVTSFFDEAVAAWGTLGDHAQHQPCMAAAKISIPDVIVPMVLPWRSKDSFDRMMATVLQRAAALDQTEVLHVGVRCLAKRG